MSTFRYIGKCAAGFVSFSRPNEDPVILPGGEAVEVPDWLGAKLKRNNHFEQVIDGGTIDSDNVIEVEDGYGVCPDCGKKLKIKKDGELYAHDCDPDTD